MLPDDSILEHIAALAPYDPAKAHQYYETHKHLKGRRKGSVEPAKAVTSRSTTTSPRRPAVKLTKKTPAQKRHEVELQVIALTKRLEHLRDVLAKLVEQAKARSGVETRSEKAKRQATSQSDAKGKSPLTAQQKKEAAKRSADYRKAHPTATSPSAEVAKLQKQIADIRAKIAKAIDDARAASTKKHGSDHVIKSNSKTAPKAVSTH